MATETLDAVRARMERRGIKQREIAVAGRLYTSDVSGILRGLPYGPKRGARFQQAIKALGLDRDQDGDEA